VRALLEPGWLGVPASNLEDLQRLVGALPPVLADAVVHGLTDAEVQRLVDALDDRWLPGYGFDRARRQEFWAVVGSRVSLVTFRRLAAVTDDLDPPPATALDDAATDRPQRREFYDALIYRPFEGWLTWQGEGDPHAISRNDTTQGRIGNCYLIAAMMGIADHDPTLLEGMITQNPNGTFTVRFADGQRVVVSPDLPVHPTSPRGRSSPATSCPRTTTTPRPGATSCGRRCWRRPTPRSTGAGARPSAAGRGRRSPSSSAARPPASTRPPPAPASWQTSSPRARS
jgi:hypothetical protein